MADGYEISLWVIFGAKETFISFSEVYKTYDVRFSKGEFANISSRMRDMMLESNTFEKNSTRRTF